MTMPRARRAALPPADESAVRGQAPEPPGPLLVALEGRAPLEYAAMLLAQPWLRRLPRGDDHPVMVYPGMGANDATTRPLRRFLSRLGYATEAWGQGFNVGPREGVIERAKADICALSDRHGGRAVSLVGWSLGGVYARELATALPARVRCVVTLGTPFTGDPKSTNAWRLFQWLSGLRVGDPALTREIAAPPPVPTTSIFSRSDGIVSWRCSLNEPGPQVENIEVPASHLGMGVNPLVLYAVADRLAQPVGQWRPFDISGIRRRFFRSHPRLADAA